MNNREKYSDYIRHKLDFRDVMELIAEEASELGQAALKVIRAKNLSKNVTPVEEQAACAQLLEEYLDVLSALSMYIPVECMLSALDNSKKWERWAKRLGYDEDGR